MRKKLFPFITILTLALFLGACNSEDVMPEIGSETNPELTERTISFTASMPGEDDPATRVGAAEEADRGITLTWDENDKLDLLFVQGEKKFHESTTVTNIENGGKNATFTVPIPEGITDGTPYNLYGVYGGGAVSTTNPELIGLPAIEEEALNEENVGKKVMLRFAKENLNLTDAVGAVNFEHVGFLFTAKIKTISDTAPDITSVQLVGADAGNETWAYNASANHLDMETGTFTANGTGTNTVSFQNSEKDANNILTVRNWLPQPQIAMPALKLSVNETETADTKPARTLEVGRAYYLYAQYDGTKLVFADKEFTVPAEKGTKENPYSVAEAIAKQGETDVWVKGYIVGSFNNNGSIFGTENASEFNINIADNKDETSDSKVVNVQLTTTNDIRAKLNLINNSDVYKKEVLFKGDLVKYNNLPGIKNTKEYVIIPDGPFFESTTTAITLKADAGSTGTIDLSTSEAWTATSSETWLTVSPASGTGISDIIVTAEANTVTSPRTATVTLTATGANAFDPIVVTVTQKAFEASIIVDPASLTFAKEGGSETIAVTANVAWTVSWDAAGWLTLTPSEGVITVAATENTGTEARNTTITITGGGVTTTVNVTQAAAGSGGDLLFPGSDFNNWATFTNSLNTYGVTFGKESATGGRDGSGAIHINGTPTGDDYVFTAVVPEGFSAADKTKITFWIKGTAAKSLSLNVYRGSNYWPYNLGSATTADVVLEHASYNQYDGTINTGGEWIQITLDISTLNINNTTPGKSLFALKIGKNADYNLFVDDITIE